MKARSAESSPDISPDQFVFSTADIERELSRPGPRPDAKTARSLQRDLPENDDSPLKQAA